MAAPTVVSGSTTLLAWSTGLTASGNVRANPTAGNLLATGTVASGTSITTAAVLASTDNGINTYVIAKSAVNSSSSTIAIGLCYAKNCVTHSPLTVTWKTQSPAAGGGTGFYLEVAGADTVAPLDSSTNSGVATTTSVSSGAATNTAASALFVGHFGNDAGGASTVTLTGTGWSTDTTNSQETDGTSANVGAISWKGVTATGAQTATWTDSRQKWVAVIAIFLAPAGATTNYKDAALRFRLASAAAYKAAQVRFRLAATNYKDAGIRFRLASALVFRDTGTRFRLASITVFRDAALRFNLAIQGYRDAQVRFRLAARAYKDSALRFRLVSPATYRDAATRFRLASVATFRDVGLRFRLAGATAAFRDGRHTLPAPGDRLPRRGLPATSGICCCVS